MDVIKTIARNKRALRDYHIVERLEAGLVLLGSEVKSLRQGNASLTDGHVEERDGELYLVNCHISPYAFSNINNHEPLRPRKLLLHSKEIFRILKRVKERGYTGIPLSLYFKGGKVKVELGLARGKRQVDKRHDIRRKDEQRDLERIWKRGSQDS